MYMKRMLIAAACLAMCTTACKKDDHHKNDRWVKGTIYSAVDSLPIANASFKIYQRVSTEGYELTNTRSFTTDTFGRFNELFNAGEGDYAYICLPNGNETNFIKGFRITGGAVNVGNMYTQK